MVWGRDKDLLLLGVSKVCRLIFSKKLYDCKKSLCLSSLATSKCDQQHPCLLQGTVQIKRERSVFLNVGNMLVNLHLEKIEMPLNKLLTPHRIDKGTFILPGTKRSWLVC